MNPLLRNGFLAALVLGLAVADLSAGIFKRSTPAVQPSGDGATTSGSSVVVRRTSYLSASSPADQRTVAVSPTSDIDRRPLIWIVDGAGDLRGCSTAFMHWNVQAGNPVEMSVFLWSHGYRRLLQDQTDAAHARAQGYRLATAILERRQREPGRRIVILAHSAGGAVALAAGDALPPDSIDRMILLAPSVSTGYDVRPAMRAAREGVDVFCSKKDWVALGFVTRVVGTADRHWTAAAGRHGFQLPSFDCLLDPSMSRLRQHFWSPEVAWTGNTGGHHGAYAPGFVQAFLYPLIVARLP